jgi:hypothetical protein
MRHTDAYADFYADLFMQSKCTKCIGFSVFCELKMILYTEFDKKKEGQQVVSPLGRISQGSDLRYSNKFPIQKMFGDVKNSTFKYNTGITRE